MDSDRAQTTTLSLSLSLTLSLSLDSDETADCDEESAGTQCRVLTKHDRIHAQAGDRAPPEPSAELSSKTLVSRDCGESTQLGSHHAPFISVHLASVSYRVGGTTEGSLLQVARDFCSFLSWAT